MISKPLGAGLSHDFGAKAARLDQALRAGLAVPPGVALLLTSEHDLPPRPQELLAQVGPGPYAVRSSFRGEDSAQASQAGRYDSVLRVTPENLNESLQKVFRSAGDDAPPRRAVLIQQMVEAHLSGVMFCQPNFLDPLVNWTEGTAEKLVGGETAGTSTVLAPNTREPRNHDRLRKLAGECSQKLESTTHGWDLEWADDGHTCWLVQARPITRPPLRDELFSYANIREIMPDPPSTFMTSIVTEAGLTLYDYYRKFDSQLPTGRPLIEQHFGRPLFNISLLCETMRHWGLPTRLVTDQIGGADVARSPLKPLTLVSKWRPIARQGLAQFQAAGKTERAIEELRQIQPASNLTELGTQTTELFHNLVTVMLDLTAALAVPLTLLRKLGVLAEHGGAHDTPTGEILRGLTPLKEALSHNPHWEEDLKRGQAPNDPAFQGLWKQYLQRFGHRGFFESDLAEPRFRESPEVILRSILYPSKPKQVAKTTHVGRLTTPLWYYTRRVLDTRERWRDEAMRVYEKIRRQSLALARQHQLESPERIFDLTVEEWRELDGGWRPETSFWSDRTLRIKELEGYNVPNLIRRFEPPHSFRDEQPEDQSRVTGLPLTTGEVEGVVWLAKDAQEMPELIEGERVILVVRTVDPGWLFNLPKVDGAIVELGGDLSHGSILLREFGIPAITNAHGATAIFQGGERVRLVAHEGWAKKLPLPEAPGPSHLPSNR